MYSICCISMCGSGRLEGSIITIKLRQEIVFDKILFITSRATDSVERKTTKHLQSISYDPVIHLVLLDNHLRRSKYVHHYDNTFVHVGDH